MIELFLWVLALIVAGGIGYFFGGLHASSVAFSAFQAEHARWQAKYNALMQRVYRLQQEAVAKESSDEGQRRGC